MEDPHQRGLDGDNDGNNVVESRDLDSSEDISVPTQEKEYYSDIEEGSAEGRIDEASKSTIKSFLWWAGAFAVSVTAFTVTMLALVAYFNIDYIKVHGQSMEPAFSHSDGIFISTREEDPQTDDLAVFAEPENWNEYVNSRFNMEITEALEDGDRYFIKRAVGAPGDTIEISDSQVSVNGNPVDNGGEESNCQNSALEYTLQDDEYFMMGDNVGHSTDAYALYCKGGDIDEVLVHRDSIVYYGSPVFIVSGGWGWFEQ